MSKANNGKALDLNEAVVIQGVADDSFFDLLKKRNVRQAVVLEGRPSLDAARKNCRALIKRKIKPVLIADNMAGFLFAKDRVKEVWINCYIADQNGALCDIGASILSILAKHHGAPVNLYPASRKPKFLGKEKDLFCFNGERVAPSKIKGYVPLVEWISKEYITKIYEK